MKKIINALFAILFGWSAILQFNDPDPWLWVIIYFYLSLICILVVFDRIKRSYLLTSIIILSVYALTFLPGVFEWISSGEGDTILQGMDRRKPYLEETREFFGLLIGVGIMILDILWKKPHN